MDNYYVGNDLKFLISITAQGFSMDNDNYSIVLRCGNKEVEVSKDDIVTDNSGNHYLCIDSKPFGKGTLQMIVYADVPDDDFEDGTRREVEVLNLCKLEKV